MKKAECTINTACCYLTELERAADKYSASITAVHKKYLESFSYMSYVVNKLCKTEWSEFAEQEKIAVQNTALLVGLLYKMCQVNLVEKAKGENEMNTLNQKGIDEAIADSKKVLGDIEKGFADLENQKEIQKQEKWNQVKERLEMMYSQTDADVYIKYIQNTTLAPGITNKLRIRAANRDAALFLKQNCDEAVRQAVKDVYGCEKTIAYGYSEEIS